MNRVSLLAAAALLALGAACNHRPDGTSASTPAASAPKPATHFVFAKVMDPVSPLERAGKYEDPLNQALQEKKLGEVVGAGSSIAKGGVVEWVGIDLDLVNVDEAVEFSRAKLRDLGAPRGSVLEFQADGKRITLPVHPD